MRIRYDDRHINLLIRILRLNRADYNIFRRERLLTVHRPSKKCYAELFNLVEKHIKCQICNINYAKFIIEKNGRLMKVCAFCAREIGIKEKNRLCTMEMHHDIATGMLVACV